MFYTLARVPTCGENDARTISAYRFLGQGAPDCVTDATLHFTPLREPHRPSPDHRGVAALESDGAAFRFIEIDDYVISLTGCDPLPPQSEKDILAWAERLRSRLAAAADEP